MKTGIICTLAALLLCFSANAQETHISSPDGRIVLTVDNNSELNYRISFDGETIVARSPLGFEFVGEEPMTSGFVLTEDAESTLIKTLKLFPEKVRQAREDLEPSLISRYLLDVCADFNRFYHDCPVLKCEDENVRRTRIALVKATSIVLKNGLTLIGLKTPKNI